MTKTKIKNLRIPGPTTLYPQVKELMGQDAFNHRGPRFEKLIGEVTEKLKKVFRTKNDVLILTSSGTGGLEAAVVNTISPGDKVLAVSIGTFGDRFAAIAKAHGADVIDLKYTPGKAANPEDIKNILDKNPDIHAVLITHNETATGVANDIEKISKIVKNHNALFLVDGVSSLGAMPLETDKWGIDVVITASQKGFGVPPGLAMVSMSKKAWAASSKVKSHRFYFDLRIAKSALEKGQTPFTPATHQIDSLNHALDLMLEEGLENIIKRHNLAFETIKQSVKELGLELLADVKDASPVVTAIATDKAGEIIKAMRLRGIELAGGYGVLAGKIFRIGHLGFFAHKEIEHTLIELKKVLKK